jgi:hypothetical protein
MAAKKFLRMVGGRLKEIAGIVVSTGAPNDGDVAVLGADGKFDASVMPAGVGQNTKVAVASEALAAGDLVNLYNNAGTINARKADATAEGKECNGFVKAAFASSASATVFLSSNAITGLSGMTPGTRQYLATTPGARTETEPAAAGNVVQMVGYSLSATEIAFEPEEPITVA